MGYIGRGTLGNVLEATGYTLPLLLLGKKQCAL